METHVLKIWPQYFKAVLSGEKTFEVRIKTDRNFKVGDILELHEYDPEIQKSSGSWITRQVTYVLEEGITYKGNPAVVMGIR